MIDRVTTGPRQTRTFADPAGLILITLWPSGAVDVQTRPRPDAEWSMPVRCYEELDLPGGAA